MCPWDCGCSIFNINRDPYDLAPELVNLGRCECANHSAESPDYDDCDDFALTLTERNCSQHEAAAPSYKHQDHCDHCGSFRVYGWNENSWNEDNDEEQRSSHIGYDDRDRCNHDNGIAFDLDFNFDSDSHCKSHSDSDSKTDSNSNIDIDSRIECVKQLHDANR